MPPTKLDRAGIVDVYETLAAIRGALDEPVHRFRAAAMRRQLKDLAEAIIETRDEVNAKVPKEYNEERTALLHKCARKDPSGRPIIAGNQYVIDEAFQVEFNFGVVALREKHKDAIDAYEAEVKKTNAFLNEEVEIPTIRETLHLSWFNKSVSQDWLETLYPFITDDTEKQEAEKPPEKSKKSKG